MKELKIEWRHYDKEGATCVRCNGTGETLSEAVQELSEEFAAKGIKIVFMETLLRKDAIAESNLILFNDVPLEQLLEEADTSANACPSCSCLTGQETNCRTVEYKGVTYEEIPAELIRKAALKAIFPG